MSRGSQRERRSAARQVFKLPALMKHGGRRQATDTSRENDPEVSIALSDWEYVADRLAYANGFTMKITPDLLASYEWVDKLNLVLKLRPGMTATVTAEVVSSGVRPTRRPGFRLFEVIIRDATGGLTKAVYPNQAFLKDVFVPGQRVVLYGPLEYRPNGGLQFTNPEYELLRADAEGEGDGEADPVHTGRIVPVYEKAGSMTPRMQRALVHRLLREMPATSDRWSSFRRRALHCPVQGQMSQ